MKGYGLLLLATAVLLLLIPLPALSRSTAADTTPSESTPPPENDQPDGSDPDPVPTPLTGQCRILCGTEVVTLEERDFLIRTLAMEMSPTYHTEALKAQTVAAYTYYARRRQRQTDRPDEALQGADFATPNADFPAAYTEEKLRERWGSQYDTYYNKIASAVDAVAGQTMTYDGQLIDACYHSISSGCTESALVVWGAEIPYLQAVASPGDRLAPGYETVCILTLEQVRAALTAVQSPINLSEDPKEWFGSPTLSEAGTVETQPVGDTILPGTRIRQLLGLRSAAFSVEYKDEAFVFTVRGYGHGVGMSQYGADYLARQGYSYKEILAYYYSDIMLN